MTIEEFRAYPSETARYRSLTTKYCVGNGLDIGSGGDPVVPTAIQVELPENDYAKYRDGDVHRSAIQWHGNCWDLPFLSGTLDYIYSSHLIEDFPQSKWPILLSEWKRCLKPGGNIIILVPEVTKWQYCVQVLGQTPNCSHYAPEPSLGDVSRAFREIKMTGIDERMANLCEIDYTIIATASRPRWGHD